VYWKPIYNLLELAEIETLVVNAQHIKAVPGRKTDVKDAEWIADLLRHGLLQGSYIPDREQRELRELVRYRKSLVNERSREVNRLQKVLEGANIKLSSVASDVLGASGRSMLQALIHRTEDPKLLAELARGSLKNKRQDLERALHGLVGPHQKMLIAAQLEHIDFLDRQIARLDQEIAERMRPFEEDLELLDTIPGVGRRAAEEILAEIGTNMERFLTAAHLSSWAGMSPGNNESAGKRKSGRTSKGNSALRTILVGAAHAAAHTKDTYLSAQYKRLAARRGSNRAAVAVGHTILVIAYHLLKRRQTYFELGANYFDERRKQAVVHSAVTKLEALGFNVKLERRVA
jgi:transposase